jgi:hypothetical protein
MSLRGLNFIRHWTQNNLDWRLLYHCREERAHALAIAFRLDARMARIGLQEIEDEVGPVEMAFYRTLEATTENLFVWTTCPFQGIYNRLWSSDPNGRDAKLIEMMNVNRKRNVRIAMKATTAFGDRFA